MNSHELSLFIPNFITLLNLQFGFLAILFSLNLSNNSYYCFAISCLCDGLDGKAARLLNVSSKIGVELDSLADMVSFVVMPVIMGYTKYGLIIPNSIYLMCGC